MAIFHISQASELAMHYMNIKRLKLIGYADSRVTSLTTVASLLADIVTFRDGVLANPGLRAICDAAYDSIVWAANHDLLDTTLVTALTTVATDGTAATTDLSYNFFAADNFPSDVPRAANDLSTLFPAA